MAYRKSVTRDGGTGRSGTIEDPKNRKSVTQKTGKVWPKKPEKCDPKNRKSVTQKTGKVWLKKTGKVWAIN